MVITDAIMPTMNGSELYEEIAKINPNIKVLFMS
jgi:YesN/AraC family two-component response regulator